MNSRRFTAGPFRAFDRKVSTLQLRQETAALRDFNPAYAGLGSEAARLRVSKCFPGCPRKRTSPPHHGMSCECQYATSGSSDGGLSVVVHLGQCDAAFAR